DAYWARGKVYFDQHKYTEALADFNSILQQDPNYAEAHYLKAQCLSQLGKKDEAAAEYKTAQKLFQQSDDQDGVALAQKALQSLTASADAR
ncbi:MAG: tetratricopeptide repeat protein, partial [Terriglobales bacterium]